MAACGCGAQEGGEGAAEAEGGSGVVDVEGWLRHLGDVWLFGSGFVVVCFG